VYVGWEPIVGGLTILAPVSNTPLKGLNSILKDCWRAFLGTFFDMFGYLKARSGTADGFRGFWILYGKSNICYMWLMRKPFRVALFIEEFFKSQLLLPESRWCQANPTRNQSILLACYRYYVRY
jgi:hypothetical protein